MTRSDWFRAPDVLPPGDYVSPNLQIIWPDEAFGFMTVGDTAACAWPYLRRNVPHNWYVDRRAPSIGFVSRDEAALVYNLALPMRDQRALEIGCWLGFSKVHLALAVMTLDVVDPLLAEPEFKQVVSQSLAAAG